MRPLDRTRMAQQYRGKWLALKADRKTVIASGNSVQEALAAAKKKGCCHPLITRMPQTIRGFVGLQHAA